MTRIPPLLLAVLAAAFVAVPATAAAVPVVAGEYDLPGLADTPGEITLGPDGNAWVSLSGANDVAKITPAGVITSFAAAALRGPVDIAAGPADDLWVSRTREVARFSPDDPTRAVAYPVPTLAQPRGITTGPDQNIWAVGGDQAVQIRASDGSVIRSFTVAGMDARGIATAGGNLWIADFGRDRIVELTTAGVATYYDTGSGSTPQEVAAGLAGQVGYTAAGLDPDEVGVITPPGPALRVPTPRTDAFGIAFGLDQAYWVANFLSADLTRLTSTGQVTTLGGLSAGSGPRYIAAGPSGTLWISMFLSRRIALVTGLEAPVPPPPPPPGGGGTPAPPANPTPPVVPPPLQPEPEQQPIFRNVSLTRTTTFGRAARLRLTVVDAGTVTIRLDQQFPGRRGRGGRCVKPSRANRRARSCMRSVQRASADATVRDGVVSATLSRRLAVGSYRVTLSATNAAGTTTASKPLTVKPRARRRARRR